MSALYSSGLSFYENKGVCGIPEIFDDPVSVENKVNVIKDWVLKSKCVVVHCGAGISTSCGLPDFRGANGIWTLEKKGIKQTESMKISSFVDAKPSITHRALFNLVSKKFIQYIISQNVDGIFLKTGISRKNISELHGNFFLDECNQCQTRFIRSSPSLTMGLKLSNNICPRLKRPCRGYLRDTILDWEDNLPRSELDKAILYSQKADLCICLGTSLQIFPAANLPFICKKRKDNPGKVVIINLQPTKFDSKADLVIHDYVDNVMIYLCKLLNVTISNYDQENDLTHFDCESLIKVWK